MRASQRGHRRSSSGHRFLGILAHSFRQRTLILDTGRTLARRSDLAEVLADVEHDLTGKMRERLVAGLRATRD